MSKCFFADIKNKPTECNGPVKRYRLGVTTTMQAHCQAHHSAIQKIQNEVIRTPWGTDSIIRKKGQDE